MPAVESITEITVRRGVRVKSPAVVSVRKTGQSRVATTLLDVSISGFRVDLDGMQVGSLVWLKLPQIEAQMARVVWSTARETGCAFDVPLHPAVLRAALRSIGADPRAIAELDMPAPQADPAPVQAEAPASIAPTPVHHDFRGVAARRR